MSGALEGVQVVDITTAWAGSYCSMLLADMGADVIKIENRQQDRRKMRVGGGPYLAGQSGAFLMLNRNKRSLALNLKDPRGREILLRLAKQADILVQNYRAGVMKRLGADYESIREINPAIVYCSISGYGNNSPYRNRAACDHIAQAMSGVMSVTGFPGQPPAAAGVPIGDMAGGLNAAFGTLAAYVHRQRTGQGQHVDASLVDILIAWLVHYVMGYFIEGEVWQPQGSGSSHRPGSSNRAYQTGDGTYMAVMVGPGKRWKELCKLIGLDELADDPRYTDQVEHVKNSDEVVRIVQERFLTKTRAEWLKLMDEAGYGVAPVNRVDEVFRDPHTIAREMLVDQVHPTAGPMKQLGIPVKLSETPGEIRLPAPDFSQHAEEILRSLGYSADEIYTLRKDEII
ncbi:MAG: CoA transferase [Actinobacteria bacterium]|nr:CoA transferase [Actinomycetota bacterium]